MRIPKVHGIIELSEDDIREIQRRNLAGELSEDDKWTIDAILSVMAKIERPSPPPIERVLYPNKISSIGSHIGKFHPQIPTPPTFT